MDDSNAEILDYMTNVQGAVRPGDPARMYDVVNRGDEENPVPAVAKIYGDAGTVVIYDINTGEPSITSVNLLPAQITKLGPDGQRMFTRVVPATPPARGQHKCLLHAEDPQRATYDQWGFKRCPKSNLPSAFMVEQHMRRCHKVEWATIERQRTELEKQEERARTEEHQRQLVAALAARTMTQAAEHFNEEGGHPAAIGGDTSRLSRTRKGA